MTQFKENARTDGRTDRPSFVGPFRLPAGFQLFTLSIPSPSFMHVVLTKTCLIELHTVIQTAFLVHDISFSILIDWKQFPRL